MSYIPVLFSSFAASRYGQAPFIVAMHIYKITFVKNKIDSCKVADDTIMEGNYTCQQHNGFLIYALIKAENEAKAQERAVELVKQISSK